jgi:hypothetical protein
MVSSLQSLSQSLIDTFSSKANPALLFDKVMSDAEMQLINKTSGYVWFNHVDLNANIIVDVEAQAIRVTELCNRSDGFAFKSRLNRLIQMIERVATSRGMYVVVEGVRDFEELGYMAVVHSYTVTRKGKVEWTDDQNAHLRSLFDRYRSIKWEIDAFKNKHLHDVHCVKAMDEQSVDCMLNPLYDDSPVNDAIDD